MVIEAGKAGVMGSLPLLNGRPAARCSEWLSRIKAELEKPFAVNFIRHKQANRCYTEDLRLIEEHQPPIVITSLGHPGPALEVVRSYGGQVFADVATLNMLRRRPNAGWMARERYCCTRMMGADLAYMGTLPGC